MMRRSRLLALGEEKRVPKFTQDLGKTFECCNKLGFKLRLKAISAFLVSMLLHV